MPGLRDEAAVVRVMLDLDGVVYWFTRAANQALRGRGCPDIGEWEHWNYARDHVSPEDWRWLWTDGMPTVFSGHGPAYPFAGQFMRWLGLEHDLVVCTHRPRRAAPATLAWLARHRVQAGEVHVMDSLVAKSTVAHDCDVAIDDKPETVDDLLDNTGATVFMPRRLWNGAYAREHGRLVRYDQLKEVRTWIGQTTQR